jgi:LacI family transcriptional regulator
MDRRVKRPSSVDVARVAGVSRATVSAYINGTRYVSPELSEKIEQTIKGLGYVPDPLARALKMKDTKTIGLVIPVMSRFFTPIINATNEIAHANHYGFLLCSSEEDPVREKEVLEIFLAKRISGILLVPCSPANREFLSSIHKEGTPIVQINRKIEGLDADAVTSDNFRAAYAAAMHLIDRGRKDLVFLGHDDRTLSGDQKRAGFEAAVSDNAVGSAHVITVRDHDREDIGRAFREYIDRDNPMDGLICSTQGKTEVGLTILKEKGKNIPHDVSVICFDDTPWACLFSPPLTAISENTKEMGSIALKLLLDRIEGGRQTPTQDIVLPDEFIIRKST